jgi:hypothetical protein
MKLNKLILVLAASGALVPFAGSAGTATYDIQAYIDGRDLLYIQGDTLQWHHLDYAAVGRWGGGNEPTIISSSLDGTPVMTDVDWYPTWPAPPPDEIRYPAWSSTFTGLDPAFPGAGISSVTLTPIVARYSLSIYQQPTMANGYTLVLDFNDDPIPGPAWYEGLVTVTTVPDGGMSLLFLGLSLSGLAWLRRRS